MSDVEMRQDEAILFNAITTLPASNELLFSSRRKVTKKVIKVLRREIGRELNRVERQRRKRIHDS